MKTIISPTSFTPETGSVFKHYFDGLRLVFFDIETTGLSPNACPVILAGSYSPADETICQLFCERPEDEAELLESFSNTLTAADVLVSFNGNSFDLPFMQARIKQLGLSIQPPICQKLDLYRLLEHYSGLRQHLPDLRQKTIERYLGLDHLRTDTIDGSEIISLYTRWLRQQDETARSTILLHNADDVRQLAGLLPILRLIDLHQALYHEGFTVTCANRRFFPRRIRFNRHNLTVEGHTRCLAGDYYDFSVSFQAIHKKSDASLILEVPLEQVADNWICDLYALPGDYSKLSRLPEHQSGYLILRDSKGIRHAAVNGLILGLSRSVLEQIEEQF
jgi:uncharacterized protein YprB with RNaseH-like and TPR domain